ncbi:Uncharacterised protein [Mycobacteroides abscessus subsp. massiliense]|nr:Uncharacterised protein [Mycobacteroides abscessus subsp. massiliense]
MVVELREPLDLWLQLRVDVAHDLGGLIGFLLCGFHDLTARINRIGSPLNALRYPLHHHDRILRIHRPRLRRGCQRGTGLRGRPKALRGLPRGFADLLPGLHIGLHITRKPLHRLRSVLTQRLCVGTLVLIVLLAPPRRGRTQQQRRQIIVTGLIAAILLVLVVLLLVLRRELWQLLLLLILLALPQLLGEIINLLPIRLVRLLPRILLRLLPRLLHTLVWLPTLRSCVGTRIGLPAVVFRIR